MVSEISETRSGDRPDVSRSDDGYLHGGCEALTLIGVEYSGLSQ